MKARKFYHVPSGGVQVMQQSNRILEADVVIAGSGPGGATMARELSKKGKKVVVCEAGRYHKWLGASSALLLSKMDGFGFTFSKEGTWVLRPKTAGGASVVYCATAFPPPPWLQEKYGIDVSEEVEELYKEIPIQKLPDSLVGPAARQIMEAAQDLGMNWDLLDKWIRPDKCELNCGKCFFGCPTGAKWTAREFVEEARQNGADLLTKTKADKVLTENGKAVGLRVKRRWNSIDIMAETVILSAGGQGTPAILQRSGIDGAGQGFLADPLCFVLGPTKGQGSCYDVTMTAGTNLAEDGIIMTDLMPPPLMYTGLQAFAGIKGWMSMPKVMKARKMLSIMIKVRDGLAGTINPDESFSKPIDYDTQRKLNKGAGLASEILIKAGVNRKDIVTTSIIGAHPGGTVRIGGLLDEDCQTPLENCYCLDTSIIPESWGLPPTVTVVAMAKRLSRHLTAQAETTVAEQKAA